MIRIFLAEDDIDDQELLAEAFQEIDPAIQLQAFNSGKKIISRLASLPDAEMPEMIILDYNIPEINGAEVLQQLAGENRYDAVIKLVWSTSNSPTYEHFCLHNGASAYLVKPNNISALREVAKKMLSFLE